MNAKNLITTILLLFVGASVVVLVGRELGRVPNATGIDGIESLPAEALVVYYFHGDVRCPTCRNIEGYTHEAVETAFAKELAQRQILWKVVNYEEPTNTHFAVEYTIVAPTVVLVRTDNGQVVDWRNLDRVWELVGDHDAFVDYVQQEVRALRGA